MPEGFTSIRDLMSERVVSMAPGDTVTEALSTMRKHDIHELPVMRNSTLEGWISYDEILRRGSLPHDTKLSTLMSSTARLSPDMDPLAAAELMIRTQARALPVVDAKGHVVGVLSRTDLLKVALDNDAIAGQTLEKVMTRELEVVGEDATIDQAEHRLNELHINQLLVVDRHGKLVGAIRAEDVANAVHAEGPKEHQPGSSDGRSGAGGGPGRRKERGVEVGSLAQPAPTAKPSDTLGDAIKTMISRHTWYVAIVDDENHAVGVVSRADVLARLAAQKEEEGVMVQISGLGDSADTSTYDQIYAKSQAALKKMDERGLRLEFLGLHYKKYNAQGRGGAKWSVTAHLSTEREFLVAKADQWDVLAATEEALDVLQKRVHNAKERRLEKRKGGPRRAATFYRST
jgi:CBS domain-containing protein/ribosome-associated translation inhibitor RaiA